MKIAPSVMIMVSALLANLISFLKTENVDLIVPRTVVFVHQETHALAVYSHLLSLQMDNVFLSPALQQVSEIMSTLMEIA